MKMSIPTIVALLTITLFQFSACATIEPTPVIQAGEQVYIKYTCVHDDALAITTSLDVPERFEEKVSYFVQPLEPGSVLVTSGNDKKTFWDTIETAVDFKEGIDASLAEAIVGMPYDKPVDIVIEGWLLKSISERERYLRLNRDQAFDCRFKTTMAGAQATVGKKVQPGEDYPHPDYPKMIYHIEDVKDGQVFVNTFFEDGLTYDHPFGKVRFVHIDDQHCSQQYDTHVGHFLRSGPLVGRVIRVEDGFFITDFGDPLAGQRLSCEVTVTPANENNRIAEK